jgi:predicted RNase H-like nuclease
MGSTFGCQVLFVGLYELGVDGRMEWTVPVAMCHNAFVSFMPQAARVPCICAVSPPVGVPTMLQYAMQVPCKCLLKAGTPQKIVKMNL